MFSLARNFHPNPQQTQNSQSHPQSMDSSSDLPAGRPSPRQLQGPRPTPLKVRKDSHKINKKPPVIPHNHNPPPPQPPRAPVIIYTVSPKVIHTNPADFMTLVQRLTGPDSGDPSIPSPSPALSPAARFAAIESADKPSPRNNKNNHGSVNDYGSVMNDIISAAEDSGNVLLDRAGSMPGILSPVPASLQPISSSFFSPIASFDPGSLSFLNDLSPGPGFGGGGGNFLVSPGANNSFLSTPTMPSPASFWELFGDF